MPREIIVDWTGPGAGGKLSVLYFDDAVAVATQRTSISTMLTSISDRLDNAVAWTVRTVGRELANASGALTGEWTESTARTGTGTLAGQAIPDASQALMRWNTGAVVGGRFLKGRTFIPGIEVGQITDGNLSALCISDFNLACGTFAGDANGFSIWNRPVNGGGGQLHPVVSGTVWNELAVLRRRRG